jgi:hypothetical protein
VDVLTRDRALTGDELAYVSVIAASLKKQLGESLAVEGRRDHPIFRMSRPD